MVVVAALTEDLVTLVVGLGLTTVLGGVLGAYFQRRTWDHQNERTLAEADRPGRRRRASPAAGGVARPDPRLRAVLVS